MVLVSTRLRGGGGGPASSRGRPHSSRDAGAAGQVVCNATAKEAAKERVAQMDVVLMLEWMHLSGPLLCLQFGWCHPDVLEDLSVPGDACGGRETLAEAGLHHFIAELEDRFKVC